MPFRMPPMPFPMPLLFITVVKDIILFAINTFEKLLNILFSEVYCWYFGFTTLLFSATITDMSLYELLNLFPRWPHVFRSFLYSLARDVLTPDCSDSKDEMWSVSTSRCRARDHNLAAVALITWRSFSLKTHYDFLFQGMLFQRISIASV